MQTEASIAVANAPAIAVRKLGYAFDIETAPKQVLSDIDFTLARGEFVILTGNDKKEAALSFIESALAMSEAVTSKDIVDDDKFKVGLAKIVDGTVDCLNASVWAKTKQP